MSPLSELVGQTVSASIDRRA